MSDRYLPRIADSILQESLAASGAVLIEGPKWCKKTRTGEENAKSELSLQNPDTLPKNLATIEVRPSLLLKGDTPRLIDEWQIAPVLWDAVRYAVNQRGTTGQFILTGLATPVDNQVMHTGTGRILRMMMRPMSLFESGESTGSVSLKKLFSGGGGYSRTCNAYPGRPCIRSCPRRMAGGGHRPERACIAACI